MRILDEKGRLFGVSFLNIIDILVIAFVITFANFVVLGIRMVNAPKPDPKTLAVEEPVVETHPPQPQPATWTITEGYFIGLIPEAIVLISPGLYNSNADGTTTLILGSFPPKWGRHSTKTIPARIAFLTGERKIVNGNWLKVGETIRITTELWDGNYIITAISNE